MNIYYVLLSGLIGSAISSCVAVIVMYFQKRTDEKRERVPIPYITYVPPKKIDEYKDQLYIAKWLPEVGKSSSNLCISIKNIGSGPLLELKIFHYNYTMTKGVFNKTFYYSNDVMETYELSLESGSKIIINNLLYYNSGLNFYLIRYSDIYRNRYIKILYVSKNTIYSEDNKRIIDDKKVSNFYMYDYKHIKRERISFIDESKNEHKDVFKELEINLKKYSKEVLAGEYEEFLINSSMFTTK